MATKSPPKEKLEKVTTLLSEGKSREEILVADPTLQAALDFLQSATQPARSGAAPGREPAACAKFH